MVLRRMLLIVAILMGITALTAGLSAPPRPPPPPPPGASPRPAGGAPAAVRRTLDAGGRARTVAVEEGDHVVLTVRSDLTDTVEVVGLDRLAPVAPGLPATFDILADRPGLYPVVLTADGGRLGALRVSPASE